MKLSDNAVRKDKRIVYTMDEIIERSFPSFLAKKYP